MIEVFRVENRQTGRGPFQTPDPYLQDLAKRAGSIGYLRHPGDDGLDPAWIPWAFVFGCPSLDALKRWVLIGASYEANAQIVHELALRNFVVGEYLVDEEDCRMGLSRLQLAFDAKQSRDAGLVQYHGMQTLLARSPLVFCINDKSACVEA